ncbi:NUDIX hydrolase [Iodobacter fluviatilis]|uniref:NUDIX domain-containing protein n=1 Tax=Iodobacter fluviatilis TaxID=537 RepID=A0A377Q2F1_9NEIS|nr:NUDIX domain-containing protein [Iodobacter fluviatilis]TCU89990.1 NUDIX domain-containing protein [Iodobacter fluviatilis]STQ89017.1 RNA pyrophosphohydrolase [Iodobacter fluviatilis]
MRRRPSARLLVLSPENHILLFHFVFTKGALAGKSYWATPGGGVEDNESFAEAAAREFAEEIGPHKYSISQEIAQLEFMMKLPDGESVVSDERYFIVRMDKVAPSRALWSELEMEVMKQHRWWTPEELALTDEIVFPENLLEMLKNRVLSVS